MTATSHCERCDPSVSVLMPVYNREEYVRAAVESILSQTFGDFEFIIINDGSTDGATDILREYAAKDDRIVLIEQENMGYVRALNRGLEVARGALVARMDSDDIAFAERLSIQTRYLAEHPDVVAVGGQAVAIDEDGSELYRISRPVAHATIDEFLLGAGTERTGGLVHPSVTMRAAAVRAVGGYRPEFEPTEDRDLWLRLAERGALANVAATVLKYRVHPGAVSVRRAEQQYENGVRAIEEAHKRRGLPFPVRIALVRPEKRAKTAAELRARTAMNAAEQGNGAAARKHAMRALRSAPKSRACWKAACRATVGQRGTRLLGAAIHVMASVLSVFRISARRPQS